MNDPIRHVAALLYRVEHSSIFSYENAQPFADGLPEFRIRIEGNQAIVEPKELFATAKEALKVVGPVLRAWELDAALNHDHPDVLRFFYVGAEILDRPPQPGSAVLYTQTGNYRIFGGEVTMRMVLNEYPSPPSEGLAVEPGSEVEAMFDIWSRYKAGRARLGDTSDFCRGALEKGGGRQAAADRYKIDREVLDQLGDLADKKGGPHARKYKGYGTPYTQNEIAWLETILKKIIRRAAEVAYAPNAPDREWLTKDDPDLPRLCDVST
jgi:hypothetical protein